MHLPRSSALASVTVLEQTPSTNDALLARADSAPEFTVVATANQTAGRGRLGRRWVAPPGQTLAASVLLRPRHPSGEALELGRWGWLPLIAGLALTRSIAAVLPAADVALKWPNDVLVHGRKASGILAELLPGGEGLVLGAGINLAIPADALPTPTSTSLGLEGATLFGDELADAVLSGWVAQFRPLYRELLQRGGDVHSSGIREQVSRSCSTLGQRVRVHLPHGDDLLGTAIDLDPFGRLCVERDSDGRVEAVAAGDVTHLRYE